MLKLLTDEQLNALPTPRLLNVLDSARAVESAEQHRLMVQENLCCKHEHPEEWESKVTVPTKWITTYKNKIKAILATRKNVE